MRNGKSLIPQPLVQEQVDFLILFWKTLRATELRSVLNAIDGFLAVWNTPNFWSKKDMNGKETGGLEGFKFRLSVVSGLHPEAELQCKLVPWICGRSWKFHNAIGHHCFKPENYLSNPKQKKTCRKPFYNPRNTVVTPLKPSENSGNPQKTILEQKIHVETFKRQTKTKLPTFKNKRNCPTFQKKGIVQPLNKTFKTTHQTPP